MARAGIRDVDHGYRDLRKTVQELREAPSVKVGILGKSEGREGGGPSNIEIGIIHEFGAPGAGIPERSFLRSAFDAQREAWGQLAARLAGQVIDKRLTVQRALGLLGARASADVKNGITTGAGIPPPNAPATVARKHSDRPLVDTGQLVGSITWQVDKGRGDE